MRTVVFLTDRVRPHGTADDHLALAPLRALGLQVDFRAWEDAAPDPAVSAWVIRSPWNYAQAAPAFLERLSTLGPLYNPIDVVRWNADKRYLLELAEAGVPIIPSFLAPRAALADAVDSTGWEDVVVKPCVSAGGAGVRRVNAVNVFTEEAFAGLPEGDYLVQPFLDDVTDSGEVSCVFFAGEFSHAVRKTAAEGNFLVHEEHGGRLEFVVPDTTVIDESRAALVAAGATGLPYARVDWIETERGPKLVELELLEPELFFRAHPLAPARFASALSGLLGGPR